MHNVKHKSLSMLIRSFMETAANPNFLHSQYHTALFNYHILLLTQVFHPTTVKNSSTS